MGLYKKTFPIARCSDCSFVYSKLLLAEEILESVYESVIDSEICFKYSNSLPVVRGQIRLWDTLAMQLPNSFQGEIKVLDFGAGWGTFLEVVKAPNITVYGYETSKKRIENMKRNNIQTLKNFEEIKKMGPYHVICCNQVLEHVPSPRDVLLLVNEVLALDGLAFFSVPNYHEEILNSQLHALEEEKRVPKELNPWEHLNYFTPDNFRKLISQCNFEYETMQYLKLHNNMEISVMSILLQKIWDKIKYIVPFSMQSSEKIEVGTEVIARKKQT